MKFILKTVLLLFALHASMEELREEGIISGSIKINYPVLEEKVSHILNPKKAGDIFYRVVSNEMESLIKKEQMVHTLRKGQTLINLEKIYGIPWETIKQVNNIRDVRRLQIGQKIIIPSQQERPTEPPGYYL